MPTPKHRRTSSSTLHHPPTPNPHLSPFENSLGLTPLPALGPCIYTNTHPLWQPQGARGIYGGSVIAQCLIAAQATVPSPLVAHSMHCYFILAGNPTMPLIYYVDVVREGRSFHTRTVQARQGGKCIFTTTISFTRPVETVDEDEGGGEQGQEGGGGGGGQEVGGYERKPIVRHTPPMPDAPGPEECESQPQTIARLISSGRLDAATGAAAMARWERDPFEWRRITTSSSASSSSSPADTATTGTTTTATTAPADQRFLAWVRSKTPIHDVRMHLAGLAYFSDSYFIGTVGRANPAASRGKVGMMVSLDHSIHFHAGERTRVDEWVLVEVECPWAGEERGFVRQKMWDVRGRLVASCAQEGMVRLRDGREGGDGAATPVVEQEEEEGGKRESKL